MEQPEFISTEEAEIGLEDWGVGQAVGLTGVHKDEPLKAIVMWRSLGQGGRKPAESLDPAASLGTGWMPRPADLCCCPSCLYKCTQDRGCSLPHLCMASCHLGGRCVSICNAVAFTKLEAAVLGHLCPLNCILIWFLSSVSIEKF